MSNELKTKALELYKLPFRFDHGYIFDASGHTVADQGGALDGQLAFMAQVRGWGRIGKLENAEAMQDKVGELIAEALTEYWERNTGAPILIKNGQPYNIQFATKEDADKYLAARDLLIRYAVAGCLAMTGKDADATCDEVFELLKNFNITAEDPQGLAA